MKNENPLAARAVELADSFDDIYAYFDLCYEKGWTDGLPVYPPTERALTNMLRYTDRDRFDVVAKIPPRDGIATVEKIAINALMAGCRPEYLPVLITAIEAMAEPQYNLYGRQTTTHPGAHLLIVNGPLRRELDVNCRQNVFGHGWRANATMGRALRLMMINIGGNKPGVTDMATHGHPGKFSYCVGEDEEGSPWAPLHVERGLAAATSAVTLMCAEAPHNVNDMVSKTPQLFLGSAASTMSTLGSNTLYTSGNDSEHMLVIPYEAAQWLAESGWSKNDVKTFLYEHARKPVREMRDRGHWLVTPFPKWVNTENPDEMIPIVGRPDDIIIVVAGGHGRHMNALLTAGYTRSVTRAITRKDGTPIRAVSELIRA